MRSGCTSELFMPKCWANLMSPLSRMPACRRCCRPARIVDVVSGYTSLRKRGVDLLGLCPFHKEKTPSFTVSADKGLYYCFGCGEGGDVVRFVERMENLSFTEAIEQLGERFGVPVEFEEGAGADTGPEGPGGEAAPRAREGGGVLPAVPVGNRGRPRGPGVSGEAWSEAGGL